MSDIDEWFEEFDDRSAALAQQQLEERRRWEEDFRSRQSRIENEVRQGFIEFCKELNRAESK